MATKKAPARTQCDACVERGHCWIPPTGCEDRPDIAIVGEIPSYEDDRAGKPFQGQAGRMLRSTLSLVGARLDRVYYDNVLGWRPPGNKASAAELAACKPRLMANLSRIQPKIVVPVGNLAIYAFLGRGAGVTTRRGVYREVELSEGQTVGVIPTFNPASVLRAPDSYMDFYDDLKRVIETVDGVPPVVEPPYDHYIHVETQDMFDAVIRRLASVTVASLDLETTALWPQDGEILSIQLSWKEGTAVAINWQTLIEGNPVNHEALRQALEPIRCVAHNGQFDMQWLASRGIAPLYWMDTMLAHYTVDERQGVHGLKRLSIQRYRAPDYDVDLKKFLKEERKRLGISSPGGSTDDDGDRKAPLILSLEDWKAPTIRERILSYGAADADYTYRLARDLRKEMDEDGVTHVHDRFLIPAAEYFMELERVGLRIDTEYHDSVGQRWYQELNALEAKLRSTPGAEALNFNSHPQLKQFLYGELGLRPMTGVLGETIRQDDLLAEIQDIEDEEAQEYWHSSSAHARKKMKTDATSTYMLYWLSQQHEFPRLMVQHRLVSKKISAYYEGYRRVMRNGRIHPRYRLHGTRTGRFSVTDPNMHGVTRMLEIKRFYAADPGYTILYADYSQVELRMLAHYSGDEHLMAIMEETDVHRGNMRRLFGVTDAEIDAMDPERAEFMRRAAKILSFGVIYGISSQSLSPQLGTDVEEAEEYRMTFLRSIPQGSRWMMQQKRRAVTEQEVESLTGYKRRFPVILDRKHLGEIERQAVNMPIQNAASVMTAQAMMRAWRELDGVRPGPHIHDGFWLQVPTPTVERAAARLRDILHDAPFETRVHFAAEVKVGPNWGDLETVYKD